MQLTGVYTVAVTHADVMLVETQCQGSGNDSQYGELENHQLDESCQHYGGHELCTRTSCLLLPTLIEKQCHERLKTMLSLTTRSCSTPVMT